MLPLRRMGAIALAMLSMLALATPTRAGGCHLIVTSGGGSPAAVTVGDVVSVEGFEFAVGDVELAMTVDGTAVRTATVTAADAFGNTGYFGFNVTADADGHWGLVATEVEGSCSASEGFQVAPTPAPTPSAGPSMPDAAIESPRPAPSPALALGAALIVVSALTLVVASGRIATLGRRNTGKRPGQPESI